MNRIPLDELTSDQLDALYEDRDRLTAAMRRALDALRDAGLYNPNAAAAHTLTRAGRILATALPTETRHARTR